MEEHVRAAIVAAVDAYVQEQARETPSVMPATFSTWKLFGLRELMRKRTSIQKRVQRLGERGRINESSQEES